MPSEQSVESFSAFRVAVDGENVSRGLGRVPASVLPDADVTVAVAYSSLNYKDALSASGNRGVTRHYPHTPGIDAAGTVVASRDARFEPGMAVLCTGYDLGMDTPGGWAERIGVPGDWLVPLPDGLDARAAMTLGTAGLTAALAIDRLESVGVAPGLGPLVVTGASGGVGSLAVALLAARGYRVVASTGTASAAELLTRLGAASLVPREELATASERPLAKAEYAGGIDTVGGVTLANLVRRTLIGGAVAACGQVGGAELPLNVFPFILRGVALLGVDSQHLSHDRRVALWAALADAWHGAGLAAAPGLVTEVGLDGLEAKIVAILAGEVTGRVVVRVGG